LSRIALTIGVTDVNGEAYSAGVEVTSAPRFCLCRLPRLAWSAPRSAIAVLAGRPPSTSAAEGSNSIREEINDGMRGVGRDEQQALLRVALRFVGRPIPWLPLRPKKASENQARPQRRPVDVLGVSTRTLQGWEQGRRKPSGAARSLL